MSAAELLAELAALGVQFRPDGTRLHVGAAPGVLAPDLLARVREHKAALLELLTSHARPSAHPGQEIAPDTSEGQPSAARETAEPAPTTPCCLCGCLMWWRHRLSARGNWLCGACHPDPEALAPPPDGSELAA